MYNVNGERVGMPAGVHMDCPAPYYVASDLPKQLVGFYAEQRRDSFHGGERKILARLDALEVARGGFE